MLSKEENALVTEVGPGTPMGELFRRFWLPALLSHELPTNDGPPVRTRILGEDLVAFRDTGGAVGFIDAHCPHRGAGLYFGRNEASGLRCVYHGWKFDVTGACIDMPSEPAESNPSTALRTGFKHQVKVTAYPAREWGGVIWVYMGPAERMPELPQLEWARVPAEQRTINRVLVESSWLQMLEGDVDTSHSMFLHSAMDPELKQTSRRLDLTNDRSPRLAVQQTDYGLAYGGRYNTVDGRYDWRVTQWLMPCYTLIANKSWPLLGRAAVPIDDEHTSVFSVRYDAEGGARLTPDQGWLRTKYQLPDGAMIDVARQEANQSQAMQQTPITTTVRVRAVRKIKCRSNPIASTIPRSSRR